MNHVPPTAKVLATCPVDYTSQWKRSATTPNPAWPCNTALPTGTLAIRCTFSYLQRASFGSTSPWKRWRQTLQQSLCPWTSFYHCWSSSTQWHRTHCSTMFPFISAWPCNTALPNGTLAIRCTFSYLQRASFGSTSQWKRWRQTLPQSLCPWTSFYHRWSSSTQWHRTHCSRMFPS